MIEFKGTYFQSSKAEPIVVLVQFDGVLLHVWHLSDPFHRLFSSDEFQISGLFGKTRHAIKLPNGGRVETDDTQNFNKLVSNHKDSAGKEIEILKSNWFIILIGSMALLMGALWMVRSGLLF